MATDTDVTLLVTDPDAEVVEHGAGRWVVSAPRPDRVRAFVEECETVDEVRRRAPPAEDALLVHLAERGGQVRAVDAYRSITAPHSLYYLRGSDGRIVLTDHFRNALAHLDVAERTVTDRAVADHLLFRAPIEPRTYVEEVRALEQGAWLHWDASGDPQTTQVEHLQTGAAAPPACPTAAIDEALTDVLGGVEDGTVTNMLSGGVDSTLLQSYLGAEESALVMGIDSPEYEFELEYADRARSLLGVDSEEVIVEESAFLEHLEASVDALGFPSHFHQSVVTDVAFRQSGARRFVNGEGADALFGLGGTKGAQFAAWMDPVVSSRLGNVLTWALPQSAGRVVQDLAREAEGFGRRPRSPDSFSQRFVGYADPSFVEACVGADLVEQRSRAQFEYVDERVDGTEYGTPTGRIEFAHLLCYLRHNTVDHWQQLAHAHGKSVFAPFMSRRVAECALSVPAAERYIEGPGQAHDLETKYLLKRLLGERLPEYPTTQPKGAGRLPVDRYFSEGSLAGVFEKYDPPAFVPEHLYGSHVERLSPETWMLVTYAVWRDRVLQNPELSPVEGTRAFE